VVPGQQLVFEAAEYCGEVAFNVFHADCLEKIGILAKEHIARLYALTQKDGVDKREAVVIDAIHVPVNPVSSSTNKELRQYATRKSGCALVRLT